MAKRVFISFAVDDKWARDMLVGQARNDNSPFELIDMSVKEPFSERWKTQCRERIRSCSAFIGLISKKTWNADGARWEMKCAKEEGLPRLGVRVKADEGAAIPPEMQGAQVITWTWEGIKKFLES